MDKIILRKDILGIVEDKLYFESIDMNDLTKEELEKHLVNCQKHIKCIKDLMSKGVECENTEDYETFLKLLYEEKYEELIKYEIQ